MRMAERTRTGGRAATNGVIGGGTALAVGNPGTPLPEGFSWQALDGLARLESGHTPSRRIVEYWDGDVPWIGIRDATANHGRTIFDTKQHISQAGVANSSTRLLPANTVCLSRTASVGYVVTMGVPMCTSQDFVNWVCGPRLSHRYLALLLRLEQETVRRFSSGTTHQTVYFPEAKAFHIAAPELAEQKAIVAVLGALDDKIESNRRCVALMVKLAQAVLFSDVGARPVRLGDVAILDKGVSYKGAGLVDSASPSARPLVNLGNFPVDSSWLNSSKMKFYSGDYRHQHVVQAGDLVVANTDLTQQRAVLGRAALVPAGLGPSLISHHVFAVRFHARQELRLPLWAQLATASARDRMTGSATGTTVAGLPREALLDFMVSPPASGDGIARAETLVEAAWARESESAALIALRDALLPELLSGRIRVSATSDAARPTRL